MPLEGERKEGFAKCTPCQPSHFQKTYPSAIYGEPSLLGVGDWLMNKDMLCWLSQEV